mmetsp:Transcript_10865/g.45049  ORF Transcript_10865/g.45049 Transcript_10865/m.45049 type:complete len:217 (+) Transcript_10865:1240-1890(+)
MGSCRPRLARRRRFPRPAAHLRPRGGPIGAFCARRDLRGARGAARGLRGGARGARGHACQATAREPDGAGRRPRAGAVLRPALQGEAARPAELHVLSAEFRRLRVRQRVSAIPAGTPAAHGVRPSVSLPRRLSERCRLQGAPLAKCSRSSAAVSCWPHSSAAASGVRPKSSGLAASAPASSSRRRQLVWPPLAAIHTRVRPELSAWSLFAPASRSI